MELNLEGKVVIVTGGVGGIGRATVERFRAEGATAIAWDLTTEPRVDVTNRESIDRAVEEVISRHGRVDVLVNNAPSWGQASSVSFFLQAVEPCVCRCVLLPAEKMKH